MICMGIDPAWGKKCAFAFTDGQKVFRIGYLKSGKDPVPFFLDEHIQGIHPDVILIEAGYTKNRTVCHMMDRTGGMILEAARRSTFCERVPTIFVDPTTWMSSYKMYRMRRETMNPIIIRTARYYYGDLKDKEDDLACAILISLYGARHYDGVKL
jgi:hypothetical protein